MEPEGSLPHSQASATRPYPGLAQSSPHAHNPPPGQIVNMKMSEGLVLWLRERKVHQKAGLYHGF